MKVRGRRGGDANKEKRLKVGERDPEGKEDADKC